MKSSSPLQLLLTIAALAATLALCGCAMPANQPGQTQQSSNQKGEDDEYITGSRLPIKDKSAQSSVKEGMGANTQSSAH
jgi:hypothetical protein